MPDGMVLLAGGTFRMGAVGFYPEEAPIRTATVGPFALDETPVTNRMFGAFVEATGHVTTAEIAPDPRDYPGMDPELSRPGSLVFLKPPGPVDMGDPTNWWSYELGADWRRPRGPGSSLVGIEDHPVVHVTATDAEAYAAWAGKRLPTEAEWEFAARGGLNGADYAWGDELAPGGRMMANYWQGLFPFANQALDGWELTSPVRSFDPNRYGLWDLIGNVWEWTADPWGAASRPGRKASCCGGRRKGGGPGSSPPDAAGRPRRRVLKGGSHLCAPNYCQRYRPAARHPEDVDTSTSHIGFRCARDARP